MEDKIVKAQSYTAEWELNPLYTVECPHCKAIIIMGKRSLIKRLIDWAKMIKNK